VEERGIHDVKRRCLRTGYTGGVLCAHHGWEAEEGDGLEGIKLHADAGWHSPVRSYGYCGMYLSVESSAPWLIPYSHTCSILMTAFSWAGNCLRAGFSAQLAGVSASSQLYLSLLQPSSLRRKMDMSLFQANVMWIDLGREGNTACILGVWAFLVGLLVSFGWRRSPLHDITTSGGCMNLMSWRALVLPKNDTEHILYNVNSSRISITETDINNRESRRSNCRSTVVYTFL